MPEIHFPRPFIFWYLLVKFRGVPSPSRGFWTSPGWRGCDQRPWIAGHRQDDYADLGRWSHGLSSMQVVVVKTVRIWKFLKNFHNKIKKTNSCYLFLPFLPGGVIKLCWGVQGNDDLIFDFKFRAFFGGKLSKEWQKRVGKSGFSA